MMRHKEFSKIILFCVGALTLVVSAFSMGVIWKTNDLSPLAYLIPAVFTELGIGTGFYYNKAKAENKVKMLVSAKREGLNVDDVTLE